MAEVDARPVTEILASASTLVEPKPTVTIEL
jgi:hypothetical protein